MPPRPASIKVRALQWLSQREHSPQELRAKLLRLMTRQRPAEAVADADADVATGAWVEADPDAPDSVGGLGAAPGPRDQPAHPEAEVDALLQWLAARGYLSSERFVESRVQARQARFGNLRIRQELQQHGLRLDDNTRQALGASEEQRAMAVWQRKFGRAAADAPQRIQQLRFLAGRGFSMDVVRRVVLGAARNASHGEDPAGFGDSGDPDDSGA